MKHKIYLLALLIFVQIPVHSCAWHIVSCTLSYENLGNDDYLITLKVYRDCNSTTSFDDPADVGVYDSNGNLAYDINISFSGSTSVSVDSTLCSAFPNNYCLDRAIYSKSVHLPGIQGGYTMVYQRCCRNTSISNIIVPQDNGQTVWFTINDSAVAFGNSSPEFNFYPAPVICLNQTYTFDASASDFDGDSIIYYLHTPFAGANPIAPMPIPPPPPPYPYVIYDSTYTFSNPFGSGSTVNMDSATGLLQITPASLGVFLVGMSADEYRNGTYLGSYYRDFEIAVGQYGVGIENIPNSSFDFSIAPNPTTNEVIVSFSNSNQISFLTIQNTLGEIVLSEKLSASKQTIDVSTIPAGIYFVEVKTKDGTAVKKFVKQ